MRPYLVTADRKSILRPTLIIGSVEIVRVLHDHMDLAKQLDEADRVFTEGDD